LYIYATGALDGFGTMSSSAAGVLAVSTTEALAVSGKSASLIRDTLAGGFNIEGGDIDLFFEFCIC